MTHTDQVWRNLDPDALRDAYSPSSRLNGRLGPYLDAYREKSAQAHALFGPPVVRSYGAHEMQTYDLFRSDADALAPCHMFIHGGYWQELCKRDSAFAAPGSLARGSAYAALDYRLAPEVGVAEIVEDCSQGLSHLIGTAPRDGIDTGRITVSGSSAGAHLAIMATLAQPRDARPCGLVLLSGIYDLEPLVGTYINDVLGLTETEAKAVSPIYQDLSGCPPVVIAWGAVETEEFKRQSKMFAALLRQAGCDVLTQEVVGRNHFDIVHDLTGDTDLARTIRRHLPSDI